MTSLTRTLLHKSLYVATDEIAVSFFVPTLKIRNNTLVGSLVRTPTAERDFVCLLARSVQNYFDILGLELASWYLQTKPVAIGNHLQFFGIPCICINTVIRTDSALCNGETTIGYNKLWIHFHACAQTRTNRTCPMR